MYLIIFLFKNKILNAKFTSASKSVSIAVELPKRLPSKPWWELREQWHHRATPHRSIRTTTITTTPAMAASSIVIVVLQSIFVIVLVIQKLQSIYCYSFCDTIYITTTPAIAASSIIIILFLIYIYIYIYFSIQYQYSIFFFNIQLLHPPSLFLLLFFSLYIVKVLVMQFICNLYALQFSSSHISFQQSLHPPSVFVNVNSVSSV